MAIDWKNREANIYKHETYIYWDPISQRKTSFPVITSSVILGTITSAAGPMPIRDIPLGPV